MQSGEVGRGSRPRYDRRGWALCYCEQCGGLNYVEPHGYTAACKRCGMSTVHANLPYEHG